MTTRLSCAEDLMEQEADYIAALGAVTSGKIEGNILTLSSADSELTYYEVGTEKPVQLPE